MEVHRLTASGGGSLETMAVEPLLTRDYDSRPSLVYERLRAKYGPVAPVDLLGVPVWLALGYSQVLEVLRNQRGIWSKRLSDWTALAEGRVPRDWPLLPALEVNHVIFQEGDRLRSLRAAYYEALKPFQDAAHPQGRQLRDAISRSADELIDVMTEGGGRTGLVDLCAQYARPLPLMVVDHLLGFQSGRGDEVLMDMWRVLDAGPDSAAALERLLAALSELGAAKMARPGDDFPSYLLAAYPELTVDELSRELMMLVGVTGDHTGVLIGNTIAEVITADSGARDSLSMGMLRETVNRVAMVNPPMANLTFRCPTVDTRLGDFTIAAGEPVFLSVAAAHHDPAFAGSMHSDSVISSRAHLAWGAGPHECLGRELATTIVTIAISRLFTRFSSLALTLPADQLPWRSSPLMRGLRSLPVQYELAEGAVPAAPPASRPAEASAPSAPAADGGGETARPSLWRFLRSLRRGGR
ncbi:cytochrome P450 [Actinomadura rubrobrunea]|uniref:Cytochrome P450 n=1 Tax=Actinomadura rubrobrunea TaxID=115335 RepID=A0A9W6UXT3_9ACTN|nr:cytochrome P450 [Actinomadura rubrobrunea]GLW67684.1 cytochrome P450 [Actinomadura rubrobrunea]